MNITYIFNDNDGNSHFGEEIMEMESYSLTFLNIPVFVSKKIEAKTYHLTLVPVNCVANFHPIPTREFIVMIKGKIEIIVSDSSRICSPGDMALFEDLIGKGHSFKNVGNDPAIFLTIKL